MDSFLYQTKTLEHAEAVLLVDDRESQPFEFDVLFQQSVRAYGDMCEAFHDQLLQFRFFAAAGGTGEQDRDIPELGENLSKIEAVLDCENLGGREHGYLVAVFN